MNTLKTIWHYLFVKTDSFTPLELALIASAGAAMAHGAWGKAVGLVVICVLFQEFREGRK